VFVLNIPLMKTTPEKEAVEMTGRAGLFCFTLFLLWICFLGGKMEILTRVVGIGALSVVSYCGVLGMISWEDDLRQKQRLECENEELKAHIRQAPGSFTTN
jgi:hypothetical protein